MSKLNLPPVRYAFTGLFEMSLTPDGDAESPDLYTVVQDVAEIADYTAYREPSGSFLVYVSPHLEPKYFLRLLEAKGVVVRPERRPIRTPPSPDHYLYLSGDGSISIPCHTPKEVRALSALHTLGVDVCPCLRVAWALFGCLRRGDRRHDDQHVDTVLRHTFHRTNTLQLCRSGYVSRPQTLRDKAATRIARIISDLITSGAVVLPGPQTITRKMELDVTVKLVPQGSASIEVDLEFPHSRRQPDSRVQCRYCVCVPLQWIRLYTDREHVVLYKGRPHLVLERSDHHVTIAVVREYYSVEARTISLGDASTHDPPAHDTDLYHPSSSHPNGGSNEAALPLRVL